MTDNNSRFKNRFSLNYKNNSIEEKFEKLRQDKISKHNLMFLSTGLILSITAAILQLIFKSKLLASNIGWYYHGLYISIAISVITIIDLILVSFVKNFKFQRYSTLFSYVLITIPFIICRIYLINILQDGTKISNAMIALFLAEMIGRFMCYYTNMLTFFEGFFANLLCIIILVVFWPLVFGSSNNEAYIIGYFLMITFLNAFAYLYECEIKNTFYVNYQLDIKNKLHSNIMDNMSSGYICIKDKKIDFVNSPMLQLMKSNIKISKILGTCELISDISKDQKEDNILRISGLHLEKTNEEMLSIIREDEQVCTKIMHVVMSDIRGDVLALNDQRGLNHITENSMQKSDINLSNSNCNLINQFTTGDFLQEFQSNYLNKNLSENFTRLGYKNIEVDSVCEGVRTTEMIYLEITGRFYKSSEHNESEIFEFILKDITKIRNLEKKNAEFKSKFMLLSKFAHKFEYPIISILELVNKLLNGLEINKEADMIINIENNDIRLKNSMSSLIQETLPSIKVLSDYLLLRVKDLDFFSQNKKEELNSLKEVNNVDLKEFLKFCEEISNGLLKLNNKQSCVSFVMNKGENLPAKILIDKTKLKQILINLLSNAIKHTGKGQVILGVEAQTEGVLRFLVEDTGSGATNDTTISSLKPYIKSKSSNNKICAGLGLTIVSDLSHQLGSRISFDSKLGEGSKFWFDLNYTKLEPIEEEENKDLVSHNVEEVTSLPKIEVSEIELSQVNLNVNQLKNPMSPSAHSRSSQITLKRNMALSHPIMRENPSTIIINNHANYLRNKSINPNESQIGKSFISELNMSTEYLLDLDHNLYNYIVADDERFTRKAVIRLLTLAGRNLNKNVKFIESEDGIETLFIIYQSVLKGVKISGVISSETMKLMTGSKSAQLMKAIDKNSLNTIPFFITTAQDDKYSIQKLQHVDAIYKKPMKLQDAENILSR